jgi:hypothetical protein
VSKQTAPAEFRSVGRPRRGAGGWNLDSFEGDGGITKLASQLTEAQERRLAEIAARLNIPAESLAEAAVRELVDQSEGDFDQVAKRLLEKNRKLHERLR